MLKRACVNESNREPRPAMKHPHVLIKNTFSNGIGHWLSCAYMRAFSKQKGEAHV
jgi:hypothetical protein